LLFPIAFSNFLSKLIATMRHSLLRQTLAALLLSSVALTACNAGTDNSAGGNPTAEEKTASAPGEVAEPAPETTGDRKDAKVLIVGAIPDQNPEELNRLYDKLTAYLGQELGVDVQYKQMTDYPAAVSAFKVGDLDLVWFGGLTGTQARLQVEGAQAIAQRDIDAEFHSVFIGNSDSGLEPFDSVDGLATLKGHSFTFGSESSTSGRLMPQHFLERAGLSLTDFKGQPGFSASHDATLELVQAGTYEVGAMNEQVWKSRLEEGKVDESKVKVLFRTPAYYDYHWVLQPSVDQRFGEGFTEKVQQAFLKLSPSDPDQAEILKLFGAEQFIETNNDNYADIEAVGREIGKIQ
jgi:phosphonate transport system substrate-binding protein